VIDSRAAGACAIGSTASTDISTVALASARPTYGER
jgi:hypothetical protein